MKNYKTISLLRLLKCLFELSSSVGIIISFCVYYFKENEVLSWVVSIITVLLVIITYTLRKIYYDLKKGIKKEKR